MGRFVIDEFWVPVTHERADISVFGSVMEAFEIKSPRDNLNRLPRQVAAYDRIFDLCTLVVAEKHLRRAVEVVSEWWGVIMIADSNTPI